ncbi:unnamed protein product [Protopolystoma xenopodis]|uniref:Uncharacterized protein n=1 Tax=Protopolystoma xenopodis TaxID=117903 RepID=A0A448WR75_9PLAT|nr:unnamed protein product [Protopolystoma xenopodis]
MRAESSTRHHQGRRTVSRGLFRANQHTKAQGNPPSAEIVRQTEDVQTLRKRKRLQDCSPRPNRRWAFLSGGLKAGCSSNMYTEGWEMGQEGGGRRRVFSSTGVCRGPVNIVEAVAKWGTSSEGSFRHYSGVLMSHRLACV